MSATPPTEPVGEAPIAPTAPQKHRACDECRTRKLACTKEPDGCSRCKREGIRCHYSPQKPMGRPRKRARDDEAEADVAEGSNAKSSMTEVPMDTLDPGMSFYNMLADGGLELNNMESNEFNLDQDVPLSFPNEPKGADWPMGFSGNMMGDLHFDSKMVETAPSFAASNIDPALFGPDAPESVPSLSSTSNSPGDTTTPPHNGSPGCACTANLYLAIDSMQKLSTDITEGICQSRTASRTAYEVVNCSLCSNPAFEVPNPNIPTSARQIYNWQNLMLLATLIPSIVSAYERILHAVDQEMRTAQRERRQLTFMLSSYGGIWGRLAPHEGNSDPCGAKEMLDSREMEPALWRLTIRALLKVDVYGLTEKCGDSGPRTHRSPVQLGLKDIVLQMENRSRQRHAVMDAMILSGAWPDQHSALKMHKTGERPTCMKIIDIAKSAVDGLVIA